MLQKCSLEFNMKVKLMVIIYYDGYIDNGAAFIFYMKRMMIRMTFNSNYSGVVI